MSHSDSQRKAWKKYQDTKKLLKSKPELSWLGDRTGMQLDQKIRFLSSVCLSLGLNINLRDAMCIRFIQKFVHEDNIEAYGDKTLDTISKLAVLSADDKPRKEKDDLQEEIEGKEETSENHREGVIKS